MAAQVQTCASNASVYHQIHQWVCWVEKKTHLILLLVGKDKGLYGNKLQLFYLWAEENNLVSVCYSSGFIFSLTWKL